MNPDELSSLVTSHGHSCRLRGEEVQVEVCWFCGNDRWNLELNPEKGVGHCWACRKGGRLDTLLLDILGVETHFTVQPRTAKQPAPPDSPEDMGLMPTSEVHAALEYLERKRFLPRELHRPYEISVCTAPRHPFFDRIIFQMRDFWSRRTVGYVARRFRGSRGPKYLSSGGTDIVGYRSSKEAPYVICEGVFDGIALHRAGANAAVLRGVDHEDLETRPGRFPAQAQIVVCLDGEAVSNARRITALLSQVRSNVRMISLPAGLDPGVLAPEVLAALLASSDTVLAAAESTCSDPTGGSP